MIDFTNPTAPKEIAYYKFGGPADIYGSDNWSAYSYTGPRFSSAGVPVYASDGVEQPSTAPGTVVFRTTILKPGRQVDHLNPQTLDK